jgi:hypothetical protein
VIRASVAPENSSQRTERRVSRCSTINTTKRWQAAHPDESLGFDLDVPGFDPAWAFDVSQTHATSVTAYALDGAVGYWTTRTLR